MLVVQVVWGGIGTYLNSCRMGVTRVAVLIVVEFVDLVFVDARICLECTTNCSSTGVRYVVA